MCFRCPAALFSDHTQVSVDSLQALLARLVQVVVFEMPLGLVKKAQTGFCVFGCFRLSHSLPHRPLEADPQQLARLGGELEWEFLEDAAAEAVDYHVVGLFLVYAALLEVEELVVVDL